MAQDQLFKDLLQEFFQEFLELFYPKIAERLDFNRVTFLNKEVFTNLIEGRSREADLVARVYTKDGKPEIILVNVEVQTQRRRTVPYRIFEYYALFRIRYRIPVLPIVLYLAPGTGGVVEETYAEALFGDEVLRFRYRAVGLPDLESEAYQSGPNPVGPTLSALMKPGAIGDVLRKAMILRERAIIEQNEARRALLFHIVDRYLPLKPAEQAEFRQLIAQPEYSEVNEMIMSGMDYARNDGIRQGIQQGIQQGIDKGLLSGMRRALLRQLAVRFGAIPTSIQTRIETIDSSAELELLLDRIVTAPDLNAMGLN